MKANRSHSKPTQYMSIQEPTDQAQPSINPNVGMFHETYQNSYDSNNGDNQQDLIHLENFNKHFQS